MGRNFCVHRDLMWWCRDFLLYFILWSRKRIKRLGLSTEFPLNYLLSNHSSPWALHLNLRPSTETTTDIHQNAHFNIFGFSIVVADTRNPFRLSCFPSCLHKRCHRRGNNGHCLHSSLISFSIETGCYICTPKRSDRLAIKIIGWQPNHGLQSKEWRENNPQTLSRSLGFSGEDDRKTKVWKEFDSFNTIIGSQDGCLSSSFKQITSYSEHQETYYCIPSGHVLTHWGWKEATRQQT